MRRLVVLSLVLLMVLPSLALAKKQAMGQWGGRYGVYNNQFPCVGGMSDFRVAGFQFYFPINRYVAIGPSGLFNKFEADWPKLPNEEGYGCDYWQASLDVKISTFPYKLINPYFIFHLGAYEMRLNDLPAGTTSQDLMANEGTHSFVAGSFGLEFSLDQFVIGAHGTAMTYEKLKLDPSPHTETDVNLIYTAFVGFHYKL